MKKRKVLRAATVLGFRELQNVVDFVIELNV